MIIFTLEMKQRSFRNGFLNDALSKSSYTLFSYSVTYTCIFPLKETKTDLTVAYSLQNEGSFDLPYIYIAQNNTEVITLFEVGQNSP